MTMRAIVVAIALVACGGKKHDEDPPPTDPLPDLPDAHTVDWPGLRYDLGSFGQIKTDHGHAAFRVVEEVEGEPRAIAATDMRPHSWPGTLDVAPPVYDDLDGDSHDEALIAYDLASAPNAREHQYGIYLYTLRNGEPKKLATAVFGAARREFRVENHVIVTALGKWKWDAASKQLLETP